MTNTQNVCRFCLKIVVNAANEFSPLDAAVIEKLSLVIPDLKLTSISNAVICKTCKDTLEESHKLMRTCSSSNKLIKFLKDYAGVSQSVELKELIKSNQKNLDDKWPRNEHVCRICLNSNEGSYTTVKDAKSAEYGATLKSSLSALDENLTINPLICTICIRVLCNMSTFTKELMNVEKKVILYCQKVSNKSVDLVKVLDFIEEEKQEFRSAYEDNDDQKDVSNKEKSVEEGNKIYTPFEDFHEEPPEKQHIETKSNDVAIKMDVEDVDNESESSVITAEYSYPYIDADGIPHFPFTPRCVLNQFKRRHRIDEWVQKVEEIKTKLNWSDSKTKFKILEKMRELPELRSWFSSTGDLLSWDEWKEKLIHCFPDDNDYYCNIVKVMKRKKRVFETFVQYYNDKMLLLEPLNMSGEQAVSFLLGGVTHAFHVCTGRMGRYKTPAELLEFFRSCDDKNAIKSSQKKQKKQDMEENVIVSCEFCKKVGHSVGVCWEKKKDNRKKRIEERSKTKTKSLIVLLENKRLDPSMSASQLQNEANKSVSNRKCSCCDRVGHLSANCPLVNTSTQSEKGATNQDAQNSSKIVHEKRGDSYKAKNNQHVADANKQDSKLVQQQIPLRQEGQAMKSTDESKGKAELSDKPQLSQKSINTGQGPKCACCDKLGHSSMDCPLIRNKPEVRQTQRQDKSSTSSERGRQIENKTAGHDSIASRSGSAENSSRAAQNAKQENQSQRKCSYCDKTGHSSLVCPLIDSDNKKSPRTNIKIVLDKERLNKTNLSIGSFDAKDDLVCAEVQNKERPTLKKVETLTSKNKCSCCDKVGHTSLDCPLLGLNTKIAAKKSTDNVTLNQSKGEVKTPVTKNLPKPKDDGKQKYDESKKCSCCDKLGHSSLNCPLIGINKNAIKQNMDKSPRYQPKKEDVSSKKTAQNKNLDQPMTRCSSCDKFGHFSLNCPLVKDNKNTAAKQSTVQSGDKNQFQSRSQSSTKCPRCNNFGHSTLDCPMEINKNRNTSSKQSTVQSGDKNQFKGRAQSSTKCPRCNNFGHSTLDCPMEINKNKNIPAKQSTVQSVDKNQFKGRAQSSTKCPRCNNFGHSTLDCPMEINKNKNTPAKQSTVQSGDKNQFKGRAQSSTKCSRCNNFGHSTLDCPMEINKNKNAPAKQSTVQSGDKNQFKGRAQSSTTCPRCNNFGHSILDCPMEINKNKSTTHRSLDELSRDQLMVDEDELFQNKDGPESGRQCLCCNKFGHASLDCPLLDVNKSSTVTSPIECSLCHKSGHTNEQCSFNDFFKKANESLSRSVREETEKYEQTGDRNRDRSDVNDRNRDRSDVNDRNRDRSDVNDRNRDRSDVHERSFGRSSYHSRPVLDDRDQPPQKRAKDDSRDQKCYYCNEVGHSSVNCFRERFEQKRSNVQVPAALADSKNETQTFSETDPRGYSMENRGYRMVPQCEFCNKVGHRVSECFFANFDRKIYDSQHNAGNTTSRQCLYCGKFGHLQPDCPKFKPPEKRLGGRRR